MHCCDPPPLTAVCWTLADSPAAAATAGAATPALVAAARESGRGGGQHQGLAQCENAMTHIILVMYRCCVAFCVTGGTREGGWERLAGMNCSTAGQRSLARHARPPGRDQLPSKAHSEAFGAMHRCSHKLMRH